MKPEGGRVYLRGSVPAVRKIPKRVRRANLTTVDVKRCMQRLVERKHLTTAISASTPAAGGTFYSFPILSQGTGPTQRVGNQITVTKISATGIVQIPAANPGDVIRLIWFVDKQADGAAPATTDLLESASHFSALNRDKVPSRFHIFKDQYYSLNQQAATIVSPQITFNWEKAVDQKVFYQSNAGTISDVLKNNIGLLAIGGGTVVLNANVQLCFVDV